MPQAKDVLRFVGWVVFIVLVMPTMMAILAKVLLLPFLGTGWGPGLGAAIGAVIMLCYEQPRSKAGRRARAEAPPIDR